MANLKSDLAKHPYVDAVARLLVEKGNKGSTLFDLRDELNQSLGVVKELMNHYGENLPLSDDTTKPTE